MTLVVDAPSTYLPERRYILDVVLGEWLGLDWDLRLGPRPDVRITLNGDTALGFVVLPDVLFGMEPRRWLAPASLPARPTAWRPVSGTRMGPDGDERLPILYGPDAPAATLLADEDSAVRVGVDIFGSAFFMVSRYEELVDETRDTFGRFPASSSLAHSEGFLRLPIVDAYVEVLWHALHRQWPGLERRPRQFRVALTHDVDRPLSFIGRTIPDLLRDLGADVLRRGDARLMAKRVRSWIRIPRGDYRLDPDNTFDFLMAVSERSGIASAFYFLATEHSSSALDGKYSLDDPWIRSLMARIHARGHEIGFHAGFLTYRDPGRTQDEFERLRAALAELGVSQERWGGRQHYLLWENPRTWSNWEAAGLQYDSTLGFADQVGFRLGTSHELPVFNVHERRALRLCERPLIVMDGTLFEYMKLAPDAAAQTVLDMARQCRRYDGTLTLLWHNSSLPTIAEQRWYESVIDTVASGS